MNKKLISILIPAYNEADGLHHLYERLDKLARDTAQYDFELLFVDDGSRDHTLQLIKDLAVKDKRISYVSLSRNFGKEAALIAGLDHVSGDATVIVDADLQDPPELIPDMIKYWEEGYSDVYARRTSRAGEGWLKKFTSAAFYRILQASVTITIQRNTGDFRLLDRRCVDALTQLREHQRYAKGMFSWIGYKKKEITYDRAPRFAGKTKWSYPKLVNLAIDGIVSFTTAPLRWSSIAGMFVSFVSFVYILYLLIRPLFGVSTGTGYSSLMAVVLFLGGVQLLSLGIIGEYIARIFNEAKQRPLYLIEEYHARTDQKTQK